MWAWGLIWIDICLPLEADFLHFNTVVNTDGCIFLNTGLAEIPLTT